MSSRELPDGSFFKDEAELVADGFRDSAPFCMKFCLDEVSEPVTGDDTLREEGKRGGFLSRFPCQSLLWFWACVIGADCVLGIGPASVRMVACNLLGGVAEDRLLVRSREGTGLGDFASDELDAREGGVVFDALEGGVAYGELVFEGRDGGVIFGEAIGGEADPIVNIALRRDSVLPVGELRKGSRLR